MIPLFQRKPITSGNDQCLQLDKNKMTKHTSSSYTGRSVCVGKAEDVNGKYTTRKEIYELYAIHRIIREKKTPNNFSFSQKQK